LGDGTTAYRSTPVSVTGLGGGVKAIAGGFNHTVFLMEDGTVKAVGSNGQGDLGDGTTTDRYTPVNVIGL